MLILIVGWFLSLAANLHAQSVSSNSRLATEGEVLVLRNGNILQGRIERTAQHYSVATPQNNRLIVPLADAAFIAGSIEDAYWQRLARLPATDLEAHQSLFLWCLKYKLFDAALNQLEVLQAIGCQPAQLQSFARRLDSARNQHLSSEPSSHQAGHQQPKQDREQYASNQVVTGKKAQPTQYKNGINEIVNKSDLLDFLNDFDPVVTPLPAFGDQIDRVAAARPFEPINPSDLRPSTIVEIPNSQRLPKPVVRANDLPAEDLIAQVAYEEGQNEISTERGSDLSAPQLEAFVKSLPSGSFQAFRQRVERQLVFNCGDCHRHRSTEVTSMPLLFKGKYQPLSARMSQRNVYSVLQQVDLNDPENSPILKSAIAAHGTATTPPLSEGSNEYQNLKQWAMLMAQEWRPEENRDSGIKLSSKVGDGQQASDLNQKTINNRSGETQAFPVSERVESPNSPKGTAEGVGGERPATRGKNLSTPPKQIPELNGRGVDFKPKDEFDPEIFNRFHRH